MAVSSSDSGTSLYWKQLRRVFGGRVAASMAANLYSAFASDDRAAGRCARLSRFQPCSSWKFAWYLNPPLMMTNSRSQIPPARHLRPFFVALSQARLRALVQPRSRSRSRYRRANDDVCDAFSVGLEETRQTPSVLAVERTSRRRTSVRRSKVCRQVQWGKNSN